MVVADQGSRQADVVFVIEGTANISPYIESLKLNYIIPTLEYFNGPSSEDKDCGIDSHSTLYALVVFMAADCAPESASTCQAPTSSTQKFLSWLDKTKFIGGAGEACSHVAEGLSTALQVFDDFQAFRENRFGSVNLGTHKSGAAQKHCILISNSPPYPLPSLESVNYSNLMTEQLAALMAERQINFSVLSPRRIPILFKLYEKAGGDLQHALTKNYAKDRRYLVLLKGFQLQERPMSPQQEKAAPGSPSTQKRSANSPTPHAREFKQPATQANYVGMEWNQESQGGNMGPQNPSIQPPNAGQMPPYGPNPGQAMPQRPGMPNQPSHLNPLNQPNPPNVTITNKGPPQHSDGIRPQRGHSPVPGCPPRMAWNQSGAPSSPASTPPTTSVLATQLNMAPNNMPMRNAPMGNPGGMVAQAMNSPQNVMGNPGNMRGPMQNMNMRMANTSPGPLPPGGPMTVQLGPHQGGFPQQNLPNAIQAKLAANAAGQMLQVGQQQPQPSGGPPAVATKDRRTIWRGLLEFQAKIGPQQEPRVMHSVPCTISSVVNNGESDVNADNWPSPLVLQLIPRQLIVMANLFSTLKTDARHVLIHFNQESEALTKLCQNMSGPLVGCVQFPPSCDIRIMVILYMQDKRIYMGFIANDQEGFYSSIRQIYENYRKQKQRVPGAVNIQQPSDNMGIPSTNTANPNMMMAQQGGPSGGGMGNSQMMPSIPPNQPPPQPQQPQAAAMAGANPNSQANSARLNELEAARQQNLLKIQQLQQTLEAAQQKEMQFKIAQEQQKQQQQQQQQHQQQQMIERQNNIRHLQQQLQHQQRQAAAANLQMQQVNQQLQNSQNQHNPQLRNLLQQQVQVQQMRRQQQHQQMLMQQQQQQQQQQHPQGIRSQLPPGGIGQQQQPPQQQSWGMKKMQ